MKQIMLATANAHKAEEFAAMLKPLGYTVKTLLDLKEAIEIEETGTSFEENALIKARVIHERLGIEVIADDSGLAVNALDGAPGIYSARFYAVYFDKLDDTLRHQLDIWESFQNLLWCNWAMMMWESRREEIYRSIAKDKYEALKRKHFTLSM